SPPDHTVTDTPNQPNAASRAAPPQVRLRAECLLSEAELAAHRATYRIGALIPVATEPSALEPTTRIRGAGRTGPAISDNGDTVTYECVSGSFRFDKRLKPALDIVSRGGETCAREMCDATTLDLPAIESFVKFSVKKGIFLCGI
ncbi:MAG: hypothetical protein M3Z25_08210, partial [Actinomycetota bacterium]|nr:hypothetical protein [Actinomycetota bacterium]